MQPQDDRRRGHLRAGVAGRDERVGVTRRLELETQHHRAVRLPAYRRGRLLVHLDDVGRLDDRQAIARAGKPGEVAGQERVQLAFDHLTATDELDRVGRRQLLEREQRAGQRRSRRVVAAHGVQREARQGQASRAATRCVPA